MRILGETPPPPGDYVSGTLPLGTTHVLAGRAQEGKDVEPARKQRSDAGKPRENFYVSIPGVRFDMSNDQGKIAFQRWWTGALHAGDAADKALLNTVRDQLLREVDRLRAK